MRTISLFIIVIAVLLSSCTPTYVPNKVNAPLLTGQGDVHFDANAGSSGLDFQGAVGITENFGAMINTSFENKSDSTSSDYHKHQFAEIGLGFHDRINDKIVYEVWGGYGFGQIYSIDEIYGYNYANKGNSQRFFIQPNIGVTTEVFDFALSTRLCYLKYKPEITSFMPNERFYLEPAITMRLGYKYVKFTGQFGLSFILANNKVFDHQPFILNFGMHINISELF